MQTPGQPPTVLIVDDDRGLQRLIAKALEREGLATAAVSSAAETLHWLARSRADLLLLDLKLQDLDARELVNRLNAVGGRPPFVIITGQGDERVAVEMMKLGALDYLVKDADFLPLVPAVVQRTLAQIEKDHRLKEAEARVRLVQAVVEEGFSAVLITDAGLPDPEVIYINPSFAAATGYSRQEVIGKRLSQLAGLAAVHQRLRAGIPSGERFFEATSTFQSAEGERAGEWRIGPVKDESGAVTHWLVIFRDITDRKRLEKEILEISDRERQRIGQDLHDGLSQHLAGIELMSQVLEQKLAPRSRAAAAQAAAIAKHVREAIAQARSLARGLSPVTLESDGLVSALRELVTGAETMFGVKCAFVASEEFDGPDLAVATHLYRIAQEAVSNAVKHGKARHITVSLRRHGGSLVLRVSDDGPGFSALPPCGRGMGVRIMQYRAGVIGAALAFENTASGGAAVVCSLPSPMRELAPKAS